MTRSVLVVLSIVLVAGCFDSHGGAQAIDKEDCATCHMAQYEATSIPAHRTSSFPTTCASCHTTTDWNAFHPKPEAFADTFIIDSGPHATVDCKSCHDATIPSQIAQGKRGSDTNCTQSGCHPNTVELATEHTGAASPTGVPYVWSDTQKNFCLSCHPTGFGGKHPEDKFPITRGNHKDITCAKCHSAAGPSKAGQNTNCVQCHSPSKYNGDHDEANGYTTARDNPTLPITKLNFCVKCHTSGTQRHN